MLSTGDTDNGEIFRLLAEIVNRKPILQSLNNGLSRETSRDRLSLATRLSRFDNLEVSYLVGQDEEDIVLMHLLILYIVSINYPGWFVMGPF